MFVYVVWLQTTLILALVFWLVFYLWQLHNRRIEVKTASTQTTLTFTDLLEEQLVTCGPPLNTTFQGEDPPQSLRCQFEMNEKIDNQRVLDRTMLTLGLTSMHLKRIKIAQMRNSSMSNI